MNVESLAVFLSSSLKVPESFHHDAMALAYDIARRDIRLQYGGASAGMMGLLANTALDFGAAVHGYICDGVEGHHQKLTKLKHVRTLRERRAGIFDGADAIVVLGGGYGTIDEVGECLYWLSHGLHNKPTIFVNTDEYWSPYLEFLKTCIGDFYNSHIMTVEQAEDVVPVLQDWSPPPVAHGPPQKPENFPTLESENLSTTEAAIVIRAASIDQQHRKANALVTRQLGMHEKPVALLNPDGAYNPFLAWVKSAEKNRFITSGCTRYLLWERTEGALKDLIRIYHETPASYTQVCMDEKRGPPPASDRHRAFLHPIRNYPVNGGGGPS